MRDTQSKIAALLTIEQKAKLEELMKERGPERGMRRRPFDGPRPGPSENPKP